RVEDGELVAVVLEEPDLRVDVELEPVRRGGAVAAGFVSLGRAVAQDDDAARFVRRLGAAVLDQRGADRVADHHQSSRSIAGSTCFAVESQNGAERYFQPASARIATPTPSSSSA